MERFATMSEAVSEYALEAGREMAERGVTPPWILSPYDTWERNPFYSGPAVRHPEDSDD